MAECGAPYHNAELTGLYCGAPEGHDGDHEAVTYVYWGDDDEERIAREAAQDMAEDLAAMVATNAALLSKRLQED